ncbi:uncharacterized protein B0T15DRAFT_259805 [Chaetomium strumarium]|uniref:Uncharacterized protein n=1 Tax=Chaetomium strumarium TaxID=1170767 RepID=A0AAJ0LZ10_9PEZI|nr:hypothetical protein B0T15DRAFT_259805 [Chaetomium strumarium]
MSCGGPFFSGSFLSRQWHDWQSYEGPVSRSLVPAPPATPAPPGNRIRRGVLRPSTFLASRFLASPFGSEGGKWRVGEAREAGSSLLTDSEVESALLRARSYITLVPQHTSSTEMASLHAKCF